MTNAKTKMPAKAEAAELRLWTEDLRRPRAPWRGPGIHHPPAVREAIEQARAIVAAPSEEFGGGLRRHS